MIDSPQEQSKDRPFICPCGKSYLSYPALFTHIKQKHDGMAPGQVIRPKATNKRGRPRKNPGEAGVEGVSPPSEQKNGIERYFGGEDDEENFQQLIKEAQKIKKQFKTSFDFRPPISFPQHPRTELPPSEPLPAPVKSEFKPETTHDPLHQKFKGFFEIYKPSQQFLDTRALEELIATNKYYQLERKAERCRSRRPIGMDRWEMELRTALFQFLDWTQPILNAWQYRNIELLVSLLILFYTRMIPDAKAFTTANYLTYLNLFTRQLLTEARQDGFYKHALPLQKTVTLRLLVMIHEWFLREGLSYHDVRVNPAFMTGQEQLEASVSGSSRLGQQ